MKKDDRVRVLFRDGFSIGTVKEIELIRAHGCVRKYYCVQLDGGPEYWAFSESLRPVAEHVNIEFTNHRGEHFNLEFVRNHETEHSELCLEEKYIDVLERGSVLAELFCGFMREVAKPILGRNKKQ